MSTVAGWIRAAQSAEGEELWQALRSRHHEALLNAAHNRNLTEDMALFIIKQKSSPPEALGFLASDVRFKGSYRVKLALAKNPRTPQRVSLSLLKYLRIFDMADLSRNHFIPAVLRQKVELTLMEKVPALPAGMKIALSRRANSRVLESIMQQGDRRAIDACLGSPRLTEEMLYRLLNKQTAKPLLVRAVAEHPVWSLRYLVRYALIRNFHTPMQYVEAFIEGMKSADLRDIHADPRLPLSTRPFIFRELRRRNEPVETEEERVYELSEDDALSEDDGLHALSDGERE